MPPKTRGQPPKKHHDISGLQNNSPSSTILSVASFSQFEGNQTVTEEDDALIPRSRESDRLPVRNKKDEASSEAEDSGVVMCQLWPEARSWAKPGPVLGLRWPFAWPEIFESPSRRPEPWLL